MSSAGGRTGLITDRLGVGIGHGLGSRRADVGRTTTTAQARRWPGACDRSSQGGAVRSGQRVGGLRKRARLPVRHRPRRQSWTRDARARPQDGRSSAQSRQIEPTVRGGRCGCRLNRRLRRSRGWGRRRIAHGNGYPQAPCIPGNRSREGALPRHKDREHADCDDGSKAESRRVGLGLGPPAARPAVAASVSRRARSMREARCRPGPRCVAPAMPQQVVRPEEAGHRK